MNLNYEVISNDFKAEVGRKEEEMQGIWKTVSQIIWLSRQFPRGAFNNALTKDSIARTWEEMPKVTTWKGTALSGCINISRSQVVS